MNTFPCEDKKLQNFSPLKKIGYLGGGQLARMLAQSAQNMGLQAHILCPDSAEPGAQVTQFWHSGSTDKLDDIRSFLKQVDVVTFESEFINPELLTHARQDCPTPVWPHESTMAQLRDRESQKKLMDQYQLATAPWISIAQKGDLLTFINEHGLPVVCKKRLFGYDGYGTFVLKNKQQLNNFLHNNFEDHRFIVEKFIPFQRELAVIVARSQDGSFTHLPFVETKQTDSRCDWVKGPIQSKSFETLLKKIRTFLNGIDYVGVMGLEFFQIKNQILLNEVAPRVHNSGHYSLTTPGLSQFDLHNLCLLGLKLPPPPKINSGFAMANLIGVGGKDMRLFPCSHLYWYGKKENRAGRKMGHINALSSKPDEALKVVLKQRKGFQL
jgi:5-(carboxyamino)imidazole ribonucleotide synthase